MSLVIKNLAAALLSSVCLLQGTAFAGERDQAIVSKVIEGYGGQKFENMKSITVNSDLRYGWIGQGHTPHFVELEPMTKIHQFDLINQRGSEEAWGRGGAYSERVFFDETGHTTVNFIEGTFSVDEEAEFYDHFGGEIRSIDTMVAHELLGQRDTASYKGDKYYRGALHHILEFDMLGTTIEPVLWVNAQTGHISLMQRTVPDYAVYSYSFDNYKKTKGISYAEEFVLFSDNNIIEYTKDRSIEVGRVKPSVFQVERGMIPESESFDTSEMSVDEVTAGLYHAGQGRAYGTFVDMGDHLMALGGYGGLKERYEAYTKKHGAKPLRYLILTHHHSDHVGGVKDAMDLGATIVMPETARANVNEVNETDVSESKLKILTDRKTTVGGADIYLTSMPHVQSYALIYIPAAKAVFQEDLYNSNFKDRAARVTKNGLALKTEVDRLGLDVDFLLGAHARKAEKWADFAAQAENPLLGTCPTGRRICR